MGTSEINSPMSQPSLNYIVIASQRINILYSFFLGNFIYVPAYAYVWINNTDKHIFPCLHPDLVHNHKYLRSCLHLPFIMPEYTKIWNHLIRCTQSGRHLGFCWHLFRKMRGICTILKKCRVASLQIFFPVCCFFF